MDELVGRTDLLSVSNRYYSHPKARELDLEALLFVNEGKRYRSMNQNHHLDVGFDLTYMMMQKHQSIMVKNLLVVITFEIRKEMLVLLQVVILQKCMVNLVYQKIQ